MPPRERAPQDDAALDVPNTVEAMPDEFPVDFEEWAAGQPGFYRWGVAGYRQRVRERGELTALKQRDEWTMGFEAYRKEEVR